MTAIQIAKIIEGLQEIGITTAEEVRIFFLLTGLLPGTDPLSLLAQFRAKPKMLANFSILCTPPGEQK